MGMLCAPVREDEIAHPKTLYQVIQLFKGIRETLEAVKLDMANFAIQQAWPLIVSKSVECESIKFREFLETAEDGLTSTRAWLVRHAIEYLEGPNQPIRHLVQRSNAETPWVDPLPQGAGLYHSSYCRSVPASVNYNKQVFSEFYADSHPTTEQCSG